MVEEEGGNWMYFLNDRNSFTPSVYLLSFSVVTYSPPFLKWLSCFLIGHYKLSSSFRHWSKENSEKKSTYLVWPLRICSAIYPFLLMYFSCWMFSFPFTLKTKFKNLHWQEIQVYLPVCTAIKEYNFSSSNNLLYCPNVAHSYQPWHCLDPWWGRSLQHREGHCGDKLLNSFHRS